MAFEADWGSSTVLEAFFVASTAGLPKSSETALRSAFATAPRRLLLPGAAFELGDVKFEIRNSKSRPSAPLFVTMGA